MPRSSAPTCSSSSSATATPPKAPRPKASPRSTATTSRCGGGWCARRASRWNENRGQSPISHSDSGGIGNRALTPIFREPMNRTTAHPLLVPAIAASQFAPPFMISGVAVALPGLGHDPSARAPALGLGETVFLAGGALVLVLLLPIHFTLPASWRRPPTGAVHLPSTLLAVAAMLALVGGAATLRQGAIGYGAMALGLVLLAAFVLWQRRVAQPLLNVDLLMKNIVLRGALLVQWLLYCNAFGSVFMLSLYMQTVLGHSANTAGQVLAIGTLLMAAVAPVAGILSDRYRAALIASCGVSLALVAALMALGLGGGSHLLHVGLVLAVQGLGFAFFSSPNMTMVMNAVPPERAGIASALSAGARSLGMVSGMLIVGALISLNLGHDPVGADPVRLVATMHASFWILAAITALALALSLPASLRSRRQRV